jgi:hypothetical protein
MDWREGELWFGRGEEKKREWRGKRVLGLEKRGMEGEGGGGESVGGIMVESRERRERRKRERRERRKKELERVWGPTYAGFSERAMSRASRSNWFASYIAEKASTSSCSIAMSGVAFSVEEKAKCFVPKCLLVCIMMGYWGEEKME